MKKKIFVFSRVVVSCLCLATNWFCTFEQVLPYYWLNDLNKLWFQTWFYFYIDIIWEKKLHIFYFLQTILKRRDSLIPAIQILSKTLFKEKLRIFWKYRRYCQLLALLTATEISKFCLKIMMPFVALFSSEMSEI